MIEGQVWHFILKQISGPHVKNQSALKQTVETLNSPVVTIIAQNDHNNLRVC